MKLNIQIKNFGKVKHAEINLRNFTVISGPNSCGKSFITKALYSIFHELNSEITLNFLRDKIDKLQLILRFIEGRLSRPSQEELSLLFGLTEKIKIIEDFLLSHNSIVLSEERLFIANLEPDVKDIVDLIMHFKSVVMDKPTKFKNIENELSMLQYEADILVQYIQDNKKFYIKELTDNIRKAWIENFQVSSLKELINFYNPEKDAVFKFYYSSDSDSVQNYKEAPLDSKFGEFQISGIDGSIKYDFSGKSIEELQVLSKIVYLESPIYWKLEQSLQRVRMDRLMFHRRKNTGSLLLGIPQYFYDLVDYLDQKFIEIEENNTFLKFFQQIQSTINGKLHITSHGEILFQHNDNKNNINLNATASGVVNLGIIGILLEKGILSPDSMLFIDEPEVNLHPEWQHLMLEMLFELSKLGVNVIIASHSIDMMYKLEHLMIENQELVEQNHFGINYLDAEGNSPINVNRNVFEKMRYIKNDLGQAYANLYRSGNFNLKDL